jgi:hypothetical protein
MSYAGLAEAVDGLAPADPLARLAVFAAVSLVGSALFGLVSVVIESAAYQGYRFLERQGLIDRLVPGAEPTVRCSVWMAAVDFFGRGGPQTATHRPTHRPTRTDNALSARDLQDVCRVSLPPSALRLLQSEAAPVVGAAVLGPNPPGAAAVAAGHLARLPLLGGARRHAQVSLIAERGAAKRNKHTRKTHTIHTNNHTLPPGSSFCTNPSIFSTTTTPTPICMFSKQPTCKDQQNRWF